MLFVMSRVRIRSIELVTFLFCFQKISNNRTNKKNGSQSLRCWLSSEKNRTATTLNRRCFHSTTILQVWECLVRFEDRNRLILIASKKYIIWSMTPKNLTHTSVTFWLFFFTSNSCSNLKLYSCMQAQAHFKVLLWKM